MAVNRFWGQSQTAQFDPLSMQELAIAPQQMYQREQDAVAKMEAMNEAKNTINAALGDKAVIPEQFNAEYQAALGDIQKNGINPRNSAKLSQLKQLYASEVKPIEMFANERLKWDEQYMKQAMDQNNIVLGARPTTKTFDEYRKDPSALQFSVVGRDKLMTQGLLNGKEIAKSHTNEWNTPDGYHHVQEGFGSAKEAMNAYQNNTNKFRDQVESRVRDLAAANGASGHPEVEASIRQGILSSVVGEQKMMAIPGWGEMMRQKNEGSQTATGSYGFINKTRQASPADKNFDIVASMPDMKKALNNDIAEQPDMSRVGIKSIDKLNEVISQLESEGSITAPMKNAKGIEEMIGASGEVIGAALDVPFEFLTGDRKEKAYNGVSLGKLKDYRERLYSGLRATDEYKTDVLLSPNRERLALDAKMDPRIKSAWNETEQDLNSILSNFSQKDTGEYGATNEADTEFLREFAKSDEKKRTVVVQGVRVNEGSGYPTVVVGITNPDEKKGKQYRQMAIHLPPSETLRLMTSINAFGADDPDIKQYQEKIMEYYNHAQSVKQQQ